MAKFLLIVLIGCSSPVRTVTIKFPCGIQKRQQNRQNNKTYLELKHAVVHHVENNEYTMEYVQERMAN